MNHPSRVTKDELKFIQEYSVYYGDIRDGRAKELGLECRWDKLFSGFRTTALGNIVNEECTGIWPGGCWCDLNYGFLASMYEGTMTRYALPIFNTST